MVWLAVLILVGAAGAGGWFWMFREKAMVVEAAAVQERPTGGAGGGAASVLNASGYVTARRRATVSSKVTGKVIEVNVEEGMAVHEGQVLARLDDAQPRAALELAKAQAEAARRAVRESEVRLAEAKLTLKRRLQLVKDSLSTQAEVDQAQAEVDSRRGADPGGAAAGGGRRAADRRAADRPRQHRHPRAVQRHRAVEGRPARRDGVAGLGRRRLHPHRHLDHRRHALARDRGRGQRGLHQPGDAEAARGRGARRLSGLGDSRPT